MPKYNLEETEMVLEQKQYTFLFDYDSLSRMREKFDEFENVVAFTDGSSIKNPGRVRQKFL